MRGFVNVYKPKDMTSSDVVVLVRAILRRVTGEKHKVGHLGTLDPMGTGVLPVAIGTATKLFDYSVNKTKIYETVFRFGVLTDTLDTTGKVLAESNVIPTKEEIEKVLNEFVGVQQQIPPQFSAKSVNGRRAYDIARKGKTVELAPREVEIFSIKLIDKETGNNEFAFEIKCSGGTYIRSIARDLGERLNTYASMASIHRTKSGEFNIDNAVMISDFEKDPLKYILPVDMVLNSYPKFVVKDEFVKKVVNGIKISFKDLPKGYCTVIVNDEAVAIGENVDGKLVMRTYI